jgi:hypothetical protein
LLPILENLAQSDETVVRQIAVKSLIDIGNKMDHNTLLNTFLLLVIPSKTLLLHLFRSFVLQTVICSLLEYQQSP